MNTVYIYALLDPLTNEIRYIGKTQNINRRYKQHINLNNIKTHTHRDNWIKKLINNNLYPIIEVLDEVPEDNWQFWEIHWIALIKSWEFNLTNIGFGGEGGIRCSEETKKKISLKNTGNKYRLGKTFTPQQLLNISNSLIGHKQRQETIDRRAISNFKDINVIKLKEEYDKKLTYAKLGEIFNLSASKIYRTLKEYNLLNNSDKLKKKVLCVETGIIYDSVTAARKDTKVTRIYNALKTGKPMNGLHFEYAN